MPGQTGGMVLGCTQLADTPPQSLRVLDLGSERDGMLSMA
jgi:hypothetical protein